MEVEVTSGCVHLFLPSFLLQVHGTVFRLPSFDYVSPNPVWRLFSGCALGRGGLSRLIDMQSFALGQWESQTRLIPGVGILSTAKRS